MDINIILKPEEVWDYAEKHAKEIEKEPVLIAENRDYQICIWLYGSEGYPEVVVKIDDYEEISDAVFSKIDAERVVKDIYEDYLYNYMDLFINTSIKGEMTAAEQKFEIEDRELELDIVVFDCVNVYVPNIDELCDDEKFTVDDVYSGVKEMIAEYLYTEFGISIYRPSILYDDEGEYYVEHPYPEMDLEGED